MHVVVVGGGLAGATAVTELRETGFTGPITLVASESHPPYERPPLSKSYLMGDSPFEDALVRPSEWYAENDVELRLGTTVTAIDPAGHTVTTANGPLPYDTLVLATGSAPRHFALADDAGAPVAYLRTLEDSDLIRSHLREGARIVMVGAGWIGLEIASAARRAGSEVTIFEMAAQPLLPVLGPVVAAQFAEMHRLHGVDLRLSAQVTAEDLTGADLVVVGIGAIPNTDLAERAGLAVDRGVLVDATLRTSDPDIYAIGDIANEDHPRLGRLRVEHWDNAIEQAKAVAHTIAGATEAYERLPYFYTDQYDLGMEYFGRGSATDQVVTRGEIGDGTGVFRAHWIRDGVVVAAMHANDWDAADELRDVVERGAGAEEVGG